MKLNGFGLTDAGVVRRDNEDWFGFADDLGLYVVADGLGGYAGGAVAAALAGETMLQSLRELATAHATDKSRALLDDLVTAGKARNKPLRATACCTRNTTPWARHSRLYGCRATAGP